MHEREDLERILDQNKIFVCKLEVEYPELDSFIWLECAGNV